MTQTEKYSIKLFLNDLWLSVKRALPPELIIWNNMSVSKKKRDRKRLFILFLFILMLAVFGVAAWLIRLSRNIVSESTSIKSCLYNTEAEIEVMKD